MPDRTDEIRARLAAHTYSRRDVKALLTENERLRKVVDAARAIADINGFNLPLTNAAAIHNLILALDALGADQ